MEIEWIPRKMTSPVISWFMEILLSVHLELWFGSSRLPTFSDSKSTIGPERVVVRMLEEWRCCLGFGKNIL